MKGALEMKSRLIRSLAVLVLASPLGILISVPAVAGGGFCHGVPVTDTSTDRVYMADNCFTPTIDRIEVGQSVTWTNKDGTPHVVAGANTSWGSYNEIGQGDQTTIRFTKTGIYPYFCVIHVGMIGAVVVGDGGASLGSSTAAVPVAAVTPSSGTAAQASEAAASVASSAGGTSIGWKAATVTGFGLFAAAVALLAWGRIRPRRPRANQTESVSLS
jgi:plastocyanin